MKSTFYARLIIIFFVAAAIAACTPSDPEAEKKEEIAKKKMEITDLKKEQADLAKDIKKLEDEIEKLSPDTTIKGKEVTVAALTLRKFDYYVETQGSVESENNIIVSAEVMGTITQVFVTEGQQVSKGQTLAQIDNAPLLRNIEGVKTQLELATSVYNRQKNLWDQKIGTEVQLLQAKAQKENLEKQIEGLEEQSKMTRIKAPINGTVDEVNVKVGQTVSPGQTHAFRVINNNDLKLVAKISEAYVTNVKKGNKVIVSIPELGKDITTTVTFVGRNIDPLSRTFSVEANLESLADIRPNMTASIKVVFDTKNSSIVVPINIIQTLNNEKVVYIAEAKGKEMVARKKVVKVDGVYGNEAKVEGLKAGDRIVTFGYQGLNDGDAIKI